MFELRQRESDIVYDWFAAFNAILRSRASEEPNRILNEDWRSIDRELMQIAKSRSELDAREAMFLRAAERVQIWRALGYPSILAYMEQRLEYGPRTALDRLRVARALGELPELEKALANNVLKHSAIRELTRVADPATEAAWLASARGKNLRQIEELVRGRKKGDRPETPANPDIVPQIIRLELSPETYALYRQTQAALADEHGERLDDTQLMTALCRRALDGCESEPSRARYQIAITICERCHRGWQDAAGAVIEIDRTAIEIARCDAQHIGSIEAEGPERAAQDIPPKTRRFVWRRDHGRCQVPGCRSGRNLDVHHLKRRADGGGHEPSNLCVLCSSCHIALHRGLITVTGRAPDLVFVRHEPGGSAASAAQAIATEPEPRTAGEARTVEGVLAKTSGVSKTNRFEEATIRAEARDALVGLGFRSHEARSSVDAAIANVGAAVGLETVIREALQRCRRPT